MSGMCFGWIEDQDKDLSPSATENTPLVEARKRAEKLNLDVQADQYKGKMKRHSSGIYYTEGDDSLKTLDEILEMD